jgi:hypothetical protein
MAIGHITPEALRRMRQHGHPDYWEVAYYGDTQHPDNVTVECTKCGEVLVELVNPSQEEETNDGEAETRADMLSRLEARYKPVDLDDHVHELKSREASVINNAGMAEQFDYLYTEAGADWIESALLSDEEDPT